MKTYLALTFADGGMSSATLKKWRIRENQSIGEKDPLFEYQRGDENRTFGSPAQGTFKAYLWKEGEKLEVGGMIAVLEVEAAEAERLEKAGLGIPPTPEEAKGGMSYAEAASIRKPKQE